MVGETYSNSKVKFRARTWTHLIRRGLPERDNRSSFKFAALLATGPL